jgi:hypothetical protein
MIRHESGKIPASHDQEVSDGKGSATVVAEDYEYVESELGKLTAAKPRRTPEQTYRLILKWNLLCVFITIFELNIE